MPTLPIEKVQDYPRPPRLEDVSQQLRLIGKPRQNHSASRPSAHRIFYQSQHRHRVDQFADLLQHSTLRIAAQHTRAADPAARSWPRSSHMNLTRSDRPLLQCGHDSSPAPLTD
ncbi:hypothetical protein SAMN04488004_107198 [Loktanella salsilacus]|uniref:Uncharacterized protein n=1 Tax=Loktanella salsilacus TaxID=195913 RepID=A0A1I4EWA7_9RHOB|nr:hypothetical protein SAMN04488004_107198 [Loktanella salsilacus]